MAFFFTPPEYSQRPVNAGPLVSRYHFQYAYSVIKRGAVYENVISPAAELFFDEAVDAIYQGGHVYEVSAGEAALLQAAGYTVTEQ